MSTIGSRIRVRREELGLSQDELAKKLGYKSRSSINKIELDQRNLTQSKIKAIADALATTPAYIMGWSEADEKPDIEEFQTADLLTQIINQYGKNVGDVFRLFLQLDPIDRLRIVERIEVLLESEKYAAKKD